MDYTKEAKEIVSQMTIEEKISQMSHDSMAISRLGLPSYNWWNEGLHGVGRSGTATVFPQAIALAAMFDCELLEKIGNAISDEFRAKYNEYQKQGEHGIYKGLTVWSPNINIFRDPRWGRGHETYGEDPFLTSRLGEAFVKGLQGNDENHKKTDATLKHFAVHSGPESERHNFNSVVNKKDLNETYLYAFKYCCENASPSAVMGAYNAVNGEPCVTSDTLIRKTLREKWGFKGYYLSDCGAVCDLYEHRRVAFDRAEAAAQAVNAGCDLCCGIAYQSLLIAYDRGIITEEKITESVLRLVEARVRLGLNQETVYDSIPYSVVSCDKHRRMTLEGALKSTVLLKNNGILPLRNKHINVSVCGPNADSIDVLLGNYSGLPLHDITILEGIQDYLQDNGKVLYSQGCDLTKSESQLGDWAPHYNTEAVINALHSDIVIACVGLSPQLEGEEGDAFNSDASGDKRTLELPASHKELLAKLYQTGKPIVVVNVSGSAVILENEFEKSDALVQLFYPGELGGKALAQILFGDVSPSGKLPVTFYASDDQLPPFEEYSMKDRTYRYLSSEPLFPFGYGLSYADVEITSVDTTIQEPPQDYSKPFSVAVSLINKSTIDAEEVMQIYSRRMVDCGTVTPNFKLCGFKRVKVNAKESVVVSVIAEEAFCFFNENGTEEILSGDYELYVGTSLPDERSNDLTGKKPRCFKITI